MPKDFNRITGFNHGNSHIKLTFDKAFAIQVLPIEVHLKEDGALDHTPSMCLVMADPHFNIYCYGETSLKMWNEGLKEIGYEIRRIQDKP